MLPLIPALALGGLGVSSGANLYKSYAQHKMYDQFRRGYSALDLGYRKHLSRHGRTINPNRALTSYYGNAIKSRTNSDISISTGVGSLAGTVGAGAGLTWRYVK